MISKNNLRKTKEHKHAVYLVAVAVYLVSQFKSPNKTQ